MLTSIDVKFIVDSACLSASLRDKGMGRSRIFLFGGGGVQNFGSEKGTVELFLW